MIIISVLLLFHYLGVVGKMPRPKKTVWKHVCHKCSADFKSRMRQRHKPVCHKCNESINQRSGMYVFEEDIHIKNIDKPRVGALSVI